MTSRGTLALLSDITVQIGAGRDITELRIRVQRRHLTDEGADGEQHPVHELELLQRHTQLDCGPRRGFGPGVGSLPPPWRSPPASCGSIRYNTGSCRFGRICTSYGQSSETGVRLQLSS